MENRTILIADNKTQRRYSIETSATTLGELQDQMTAQGIDYSGMTFTEGISKTQLLTRDSLLPTNVMYKGQPTNNLVMLLTNPNKKIESGAMDRKEVYRMIKEMNLQDVIAEGEGQNYTRCKTDVLEEYINSYLDETDPTADDDVEVLSASSKSKVPDVKTASHPETVEWYYMGIKAMVKNGLLYMDDIAVLADLTTELYKRLKESQPKFSDEDVDEMLASL